MTKLAAKQKKVTQDQEQPEKKKKITSKDLPTFPCPPLSHQHMLFEVTSPEFEHVDDPNGTDLILPKIVVPKITRLEIEPILFGFEAGRAFESYMEEALGDTLWDPLRKEIYERHVTEKTVSKKDLPKILSNVLLKEAINFKAVVPVKLEEDVKEEVKHEDALKVVVTKLEPEDFEKAELVKAEPENKIKEEDEEPQLEKIAQHTSQPDKTAEKEVVESNTVDAAEIIKVDEVDDGIEAAKWGIDVPMIAIPRCSSAPLPSTSNDQDGNMFLMDEFLGGEGDDVEEGSGELYDLPSASVNAGLHQGLQLLSPASPEPNQNAVAEIPNDPAPLDLAIIPQDEAVAVQEEPVPLNLVMVPPVIPVYPEPMLLSDRLPLNVDWCAVNATLVEIVPIEKSRNKIPTRHLPANSSYYDCCRAVSVPPFGKTIEELTSKHDQVDLKAEVYANGELFVTRLGFRTRIRSASNRYTITATTLGGKPSGHQMLNCSQDQNTTGTIAKGSAPKTFRHSRLILQIL